MHRSLSFAALCLTMMAAGCGGPVELAGAGAGADPAPTAPADTVQPDPPAPPPATLVVLPLSVLEQIPGLPARPGTAFDAGRDVMTIRPPEDDFLIEMDRNRRPGVPQPRNFSVFSTGSIANAVRGVTPSGAGVAFAAHLGGNATEHGHARLAGTTLPTAGTARYSGSYMAVLATEDSHAFRAFITGDAALAADFDAMTVTGEIGNRRDTTGGEYRPLVLETSGIDAATGAFGGVTSGGQLSRLSGISTTGAGFVARGTHGGLFAGSDGGELAGSVEVLHPYFTQPLREAGAFVAD